MVVNVAKLGKVYLHHFYRCQLCGTVHLVPVKLRRRSDGPPYKCLQAQCGSRLRYFETNVVAEVQYQGNTYRIAKPSDKGRYIDYEGTIERYLP